MKQADAETLATREQADADIGLADQERDDAPAKVAMLESELAALREQVARLTATGEHLTAQLKETKAELKETRTENRTLQAELLTLARAEPKGGKVTK